MPAPVAASPTLYNTGQADDYSLLADCAADPHWGHLAVSPDPTWLADSGPSRWLSTQCSRVDAPGNYAYQIAFTVPANLAGGVLHGRFCADNALVGATLNGTALTLPAGGYTGWTAFDLPGLAAGQNTLTLTVGNTTTSANPTGLRIEWLSVDAPPPPVTAPVLSAVGQLVNGQPAIVLTVT